MVHTFMLKMRAREYLILFAIIIVLVQAYTKTAFTKACGYGHNFTIEFCSYFFVWITLTLVEHIEMLRSHSLF